MSLSPTLKLNLTPMTEGSKRFVDFRAELAGDSADSNMMIIDTAFGNMLVRVEDIASHLANYFTISEKEPDRPSVLWFDTSVSVSDVT